MVIFLSINIFIIVYVYAKCVCAHACLSARISNVSHYAQLIQCWGWNPGFCTCKANTLTAELCPWPATFLTNLLFPSEIYFDNWIAWFPQRLLCCCAAHLEAKDSLKLDEEHTASCCWPVNFSKGSGEGELKVSLSWKHVYSQFIQTNSKIIHSFNTYFFGEAISLIFFYWQTKKKKKVK